MRVIVRNLRNGHRTVITSWRAWAITIPVMLVLALVLVAVVLFVLGFALTVGTILLIGVPIALLCSLILHLLLGGNRPGTTR